MEKCVLPGDREVQAVTKGPGIRHCPADQNHANECIGRGTHAQNCLVCFLTFLFIVVDVFLQISFQKIYFTFIHSILKLYYVFSTCYKTLPLVFMQVNDELM